MTFDVDAWLEEAKPPTRAVKVYGRGDLYARIQLAAAHPSDPTLAADRRLADAPLDTAADLLDELEASALWLTVRATRTEERSAIAKEVGEDVDGYVVHCLALACLDPVLTISQAKALLDRIGEGQRAEVVAAISAATNEPVDVPKLLAGSGLTTGS